MTASRGVHRTPTTNEQQPRTSGDAQRDLPWRAEQAEQHRRGRRPGGGRGRALALLLALLVSLAAAPALAALLPTAPPEGEDVQHWHQSPDLVGTDLEFLERDGRTYAFVASLGVGFKIFDITDRTNPTLVGAYASPGYQNDIQVQGNLAILSSDLPPYPGDPHHPVCEGCGVFEGLELVDISNLALPTKLSDLSIHGGAHNATLVDHTVYVSNVSARAMDIVDVTDRRSPRIIARVAEEARCATSPYPCQVIAPGEADWRPHDITALTQPDKGHRLYVGAVEGTFILDVNDPGKVRLVAKIPNGDSTASYANIEIAHQADPTPDGRLLVVSDERGGGVTEVGCPGGGLHVYDITSEANPKKLGVYFVPDTHAHGNCTAHVFRFLPDRNVLVIAWYAAGSWVVDMAGPPGDGELDNSAAKPGQTTTWGRTLGYAVMPGADTWAAKAPGITPGGQLFFYTDDMVRGMDVFEFVGALPPPNKK